MERWTARVRFFLSQHKEATREQKPDKLVATALANYHSMLGMDQAMEACCGIGLVRFRPARRLEPLGLGVERILVDTTELPEAIQEVSYGRAWRSILRSPDGSTHLEAAWSGPRDLIHFNLDQGSIGWPGRGWLIGVHGKSRRAVMGRWLGRCCGYGVGAGGCVSSDVGGT